MYEETGLITTETAGRAEQSLDVVEQESSQSSETENSSDFKDETDSEGEKNSSSERDVSVAFVRGSQSHQLGFHQPVFMHILKYHIRKG